jgi:hypothetical protein
MVVDSHCHASQVWYGRVESLLHEMDRNAVERAILIQIIGENDNSYQQECMRRFPDRFASVVHVDAAAASAARALEPVTILTRSRTYDPTMNNEGFKSDQDTQLAATGASEADPAKRKQTYSQLNDLPLHEGFSYADAWLAA